jgi:chromosome segregation ATPase
LSVAWAATKGPALEITEANAQIKTLQDENKTVGDATKIKENYTKINTLRDKVSTLTKTYNALKKTAEDMKKANDMAQADEDKQVEQQTAADARNKETNAEFQRVAAAYAAAAKAVDENNAKITKYEKQVFAHAEIQADVVAGTNEKYKDLAAWTKQDTKLKKFVSLYKGKVTKLAEAMQT